MPPYERFVAWQHCHELVLSIYQFTKAWPKDERFGLVAQARRAAVSAPSNLAEGSAKRGPKEFCRYLDIANGSLAEVGYLVRLARDLNYMSRTDWETIEALREKAGRSVWGLYDSIRRGTLRTRPPDRPTARPPDRPPARPPDRPTARPPDRPTA